MPVLAVAEQVQSSVPSGDVVVACGPGNNGGDGWVAARELQAAGRPSACCRCATPRASQVSLRTPLVKPWSSGVRWSVPKPAPDAGEFAADVVVDALLGTGAVLPLREDVAAWCSAINECGAYVVAVDIPTGVDGDTGACAPQRCRSRLHRDVHHAQARTRALPRRCVLRRGRCG